MCLLALSAWFYSRIKKQKNLVTQKETAQRLIFETEQAERARISRDLHDSVGQKLSVVKMQMSLTQAGITAQTIELLDKAIHDIRTVSHDMFPQELEKGLHVALEEMAEQVNFTSASTRVSLSLDGGLALRRLSAQAELYLYRIIQEIVNNAIKHAKAKHIHIRIEVRGEQLHIAVSDDGIGMTEGADQSSGIGLKNIKARVGHLKGILEITSKPGQGTSFAIDMPL